MICCSYVAATFFIPQLGPNETLLIFFFHTRPSRGPHHNAMADHPHPHVFQASYSVIPPNTDGWQHSISHGRVTTTGRFSFPTKLLKIPLNLTMPNESTMTGRGFLLFAKNGFSMHSAATSTFPTHLISCRPAQVSERAVAWRLWASKGDTRLYEMIHTGPGGQGKARVKVRAWQGKGRTGKAKEGLGRDRNKGAGPVVPGHTTTDPCGLD